MLDQLYALAAKAKVVLTAAITWLVALEAALVILADELAPLIPAPWSDRINAGLLIAIGIIATAVAIIRRVTPVIPSERGIT